MKMNLWRVESNLKSPASWLEMHCWGVLSLGDSFVEEGRAQCSKQFAPGYGRAYDMKLLLNAGFVVWDIVKLTDFIS